MCHPSVRVTPYPVTLQRSFISVLFSCEIMLWLFLFSGICMLFETKDKYSQVFNLVEVQLNKTLLDWTLFSFLRWAQPRVLYLVYFICIQWCIFSFCSLLWKIQIEKQYSLDISLDIHLCLYYIYSYFLFLCHWIIYVLVYYYRCILWGLCLMQINDAFIDVHYWPRGSSTVRICLTFAISASFFCCYLPIILHIGSNSGTDILWQPKYLLGASLKR